MMENTGIYVHGRHEYVTYYKGDNDSNIILTVPHGGNKKPINIQDRAVSNGDLPEPQKICCFKDLYTEELAFLLNEEIKLLTSRKPHMIVCNLHRTKIDANRGRYLATFNQPDAEIAFDDFHLFIEEAKSKVGVGILFDVHGHTHPENWVEFGYCLPNADITKNIFKPECCSIKSLIERSQHPIGEIINGNQSLGYFLEKEGVKCIPSPKIKSTLKNCFTGGFNIHHHGSKSNGTIDAIQIESPKIFRNKENAPAYSKSLAKAICSFVQTHYMH